MLGSGNNGAVRASATASRAASQDIYRRYAVALYKQALLAPNGSAMPGRAVGDVLVNERALAAIPDRGQGGARFYLVTGQGRRWQARRAMRQG